MSGIRGGGMNSRTGTRSPAGRAPGVRGIALGVLLAVPLRAVAAEPRGAEGLERCARIQDAGARLECYDALALPHADPSTNPGDEAAFGFDAGHHDARPHRLRSRYDGEFTGWSGNTLFRLENGQVWKQAEKGRLARRASHPTMTIERSVLGGFRLTVEGGNESIRVERVK